MAVVPEPTAALPAAAFAAAAALRRGRRRARGGGGGGDGKDLCPLICPQPAAARRGELPAGASTGLGVVFRK